MFNFKIGADPEFLLFHNNKLAPASKTLRETYGKKGYPNTGEGYLISRNINIGESSTKIPAGVIGWDGHERTGELRPKENSDPKEVVANIEALIASAEDVIPYLTMTSLSIGNPIGGHIHLEFPRTFETYPEKNVTTLEDRNVTALGRMMALYIAPIIASEHRISAAIRLNSGSYGKIFDIRKNDISATAKTLEIRGITSEWICRPEIALATLNYLGIIWHEILKKGPAAIMKSHLSIKTINQASSLQTMLLSEYQPVMETIIKSLHKEIKTFELYEEHKDSIELIFNYKKVSKMKEEVGWNMSKGWSKNKKEEKPATKRIFLSDKKTKTALKKIDDDTIQANLQSVTYNDDFNMSKFMTSLNERLIALKIELKNDYFFYGLKKSTENYLIHKNTREKDSFLTYPKNLNREDIENISKKMLSRFKATSTRFSGVKINPLTGKSNNSNKETTTITFGIPYETRVSGDIKDFLSKIWDIENSLMKEITIEEIPEKAKNSRTKKENDVATKESILESAIEALLEDEKTMTMPEEIIHENDNI